MTDSCDGCDKTCADHGKNSLLIQQHQERLAIQDEVSREIGNDISNIEGRVNTFIWIIGIVFMLLVTLAAYGSVQISQFKDVYMGDAIANKEAIAKLTTKVEISNAKIVNVVADIKELNDEARLNRQK